LEEFLARPSEIAVLGLTFICVNLLILCHVEETFVKKLRNHYFETDERVQECSQKNFSADPKQISDVSEQVITMEEDGRLGNLLMETATLLLVGKKLNKRVQVLPQVNTKLTNYFPTLPTEAIDHTKHCLCHQCQDCACPICQKWTKVPSWTYMKNPEKFNSSYIMLKWFNSDLVLKNIETAKSFFKPFLSEDVVNIVQDYLGMLQLKYGKDTVFVSIHVRRTDYINFVETRYKGHQVDKNFFDYCINEFLKRDPNTIFLVTSDDIIWCKENLRHERVLFPDISTQSDPAVTDFTLITQTNHTIYDYGSFAFWAAMIAGGQTMVADGYSSKTHPMLAAVKKYKPPGWITVDVGQI